MDTVKLIPKTSKAKQLIKRCGDIWYKKLDDDVQIMVVPMEQFNTKQPYSRWIDVYEDEHFKIEKN